MTDLSTVEMTIVPPAPVRMVVDGAPVRIVTPAAQGPTGPTGPRGATGLSPSYFAYSQPSPAPTWMILHQLARYPSVTLVDTSGDHVLADVTFPDANTVIVSFAAPTAGAAYLN